MLVEFFGINIGCVVLINMDYDEKCECFLVMVGVVIYL